MTVCVTSAIITTIFTITTTIVTSRSIFLIIIAPIFTTISVQLLPITIIIFIYYFSIVLTTFTAATALIL